MTSAHKIQIGSMQCAQIPRGDSSDARTRGIFLLLAATNGRSWPIAAAQQ
jgi:hypothetical protein